MYVGLPQMQKIVLCGKEKINLIEQIITDYEEKIDNPNRKSEGRFLGKWMLGTGRWTSGSQRINAQDCLL